MLKSTFWEVWESATTLLYGLPVGTHACSWCGTCEKRRRSHAFVGIISRGAPSKVPKITRAYKVVHSFFQLVEGQDKLASS